LLIPARRVNARRRTVREIAGYGNAQVRDSATARRIHRRRNPIVVAFAAPPPVHCWSFPVPKITLTGRERELIALLAEGHTDVSAAEHLGISPRSVTNILRSLMDRLGVENRFQLGLALGFLRKAHVPATPATDKDV
jgi:LuxR family transcriptional regulator of spore coat protein